MSKANFNFINVLPSKIQIVIYHVKFIVYLIIYHVYLVLWFYVSNLWFDSKFWINLLKFNYNLEIKLNYLGHFNYLFM